MTPENHFNFTKSNRSEGNKYARQTISRTACTWISSKVCGRTRQGVEEKKHHSSLGIILVSNDSASAGYVRKKHETCEQVGKAASWITPPRRGVGPTTEAMLFRNAVEAAERTLKKLE